MSKKKFLFFLSYFTLSVICISILFYYFNFNDFTDLTFLNIIYKKIIIYKDQNYLIFLIILILFTFCWLMLIGIGSPIAILYGFIFGTKLGVLLFILILTLSCFIYYICALYFFQELVSKKIMNKFDKLKSFIKRNELINFTIFRLIENFPFHIANIIPVAFNIKPSNFIIGTFFGLLPSVFFLVSLGSGFGIVVQNSNILSFYDIISSTQIYLPIIFIILLMLTGFLIKKNFF